MTSVEHHSQPTKDERPLYADFLEPYPDARYPSVTRDKEYGYVTHEVTNFYDALPEDLGQEKKVMKTALRFSLPTENVEAALSYQEHYPVTVAALQVVSLGQEESPLVTKKDIESAEHVLFRIQDRRDPHIS